MATLKVRVAQRFPFCADSSCRVTAVQHAAIGRALRGTAGSSPGPLNEVSTGTEAKGPVEATLLTLLCWDEMTRVVVLFMYSVDLGYKNSPYDINPDINCLNFMRPHSTIPLSSRTTRTWKGIKIDSKS